MNNPDLSTLLHDAAEAAPATDLVPAAVRGARRQRTTQSIAAAAVTLPMVALIAGLVLSTQPAGSPGMPLAPVSTPTANSTPPPVPSTSPGPTTAPTSTASSSTPPVPVPTTSPTGAIPPEKSPTPPYLIPESLGFSESEIPDELKPLSTSGSYFNFYLIPATNGLVCDPGTPDAPIPLTGADWTWARGDAVHSPMEGEVTMTVTGWADGSVAFDQLQRNKGMCLADSFTVLTSSPDVLEFAANFGPGGQRYVAAMRRVNNVIVGVTYFPQGGKNAESHLPTVQKLVALAAQRVKDAGLSAK